MLLLISGHIVSAFPKLSSAEDIWLIHNSPQETGREGRVGFHTKQNYSWLCIFHISKNKSKEIILSNTARKTLKIRMRNLNEIHTRHPLISLQFLHLNSPLYNQRWLLRGQREISVYTSRHRFSVIRYRFKNLHLAFVCISQTSLWLRIFTWDWGLPKATHGENAKDNLFSQLLWICHPIGQDDSSYDCGHMCIMQNRNQWIIYFPKHN